MTRKYESVWKTKLGEDGKARWRTTMCVLQDGKKREGGGGGEGREMIFPRRFHFHESPSSHVPAAGRKHTAMSLSQPFPLIVVDGSFCKSATITPNGRLGSLNYMRQSKFVRFARRLIILIVRPRRSIQFVFHGDVHCFTSHVRRRLTTKSVCAPGYLCARAIAELSEK